MDSRVGSEWYDIPMAQAAAAAPAAVHAADESEEELAPKAVLTRKLEVRDAVLSDADGAVALPVGMAAEGGVARDMECPECGKVFLSDKAMYGHLRSHPEKGYKGATRPATAEVKASWAGGRKPRPRKFARWEHEILARSSVTGKRGRAPSSASVVSEPVPELQSILTEEEAAMILLDMAYGRRRPQELEQPIEPAHVADAHRMPSVERPLPDHEAPGAVEMHHVPEVQQPSVPDHVSVPDAWHMAREAEKTERLEHVFAGILPPLALVPEKVAAHEPVGTLTAEPQTPEMKTPMKMGPATDDVLVGGKNGPAEILPVSNGARNNPKKPRLQDVQQARLTPPPPEDVKPPPPADVKPPARRIPSPASDRKYECPTCPKSFSSHQALGGHMANHKKAAKYSVEQHDVLDKAHAVHHILAHQRNGVDALVAGGGVGEERLVIPPAAPRAQHRCARCTVSFTSGQALGGHMRKHFLEDKDKASAAPAPPSREPLGLDKELASATSAPQGRELPGLDMELASATPATPSTAPLCFDKGPLTTSAMSAPPTPSKGPRNFDLNELPKDEGVNQPQLQALDC